MRHSIINELTFPDSCLFLSGSVTKNKTSNGSDVDLICCSKFTSYVYSEQYEVLNKTIHMVFFPNFKLIDYLICDSCSRDRYYINLWRSGQYVSNNSRKYLCSIKDYINKLQSLNIPPHDDFTYFSIKKIVELCNELSYSKDNQILIASELFLTVQRFIAGKPMSTIKHVGRSLEGNSYSKRFESLFLSAISSQQYSGFKNEIRGFIDNFNFEENRMTTGLTYNSIPNNDFLVFIPEISRVHENVLLEIEKICLSPHYSFRIEHNQALDAGLYLYIKARSEAARKDYLAIRDYHKIKARHFLRESIVILYPYRTAFTSGLLFGGKEIHRCLSTLFCEVNNALSDQIRYATSGEKMSLSMEIYKVFAAFIPEGIQFLSLFKDYIAIEVADPIGMYNIGQLEFMSSTLNNHNMTKKIKSINMKESPLLKIIEDILVYANSLPEEDILFPSLSDWGGRREMLFRNILLHLQSMMRLSFQERLTSLCQFLLIR